MPHNRKVSRLMKRLLVVLAGLLFAIVGFTGPALAASPHVVKGATSTISGNSLTVTASIAGLGNVPSADFSLVGDVAVFSRCFNRGNNAPQAGNKQETIAVDQDATFPVRNGRT